MKNIGLLLASALALVLASPAMARSVSSAVDRSDHPSVMTAKQTDKNSSQNNQFSKSDRFTSGSLSFQNTTSFNPGSAPIP